MRVNMDSSIVGDPRFKLVAVDLGVHFREVIGACFLLWLACYERRSKCLRLDEADASADLPGLSEALLKRGLATRNGAESMVVHGVEKRIKFLEEQAVKGKRGGKSRAKKEKSGQANASGAAQASTEASASGSAQAYTPAPTPTPTPTPAPAERQQHQGVVVLLNGPDPGPSTWKLGDSVRSVGDFERAVSSWGWGIQIRGKDRARLQRILTAGPVEAHEIDECRKTTEDKQPEPSRRPAFFLGCVENGRSDARREASKPPPPGARPPPEQGTTRGWQEYQPEEP